MVAVGKVAIFTDSKNHVLAPFIFSAALLHTASKLLLICLFYHDKMNTITSLTHKININGPVLMIH